MKIIHNSDFSFIGKWPQIHLCIVSGCVPSVVIELTSCNRNHMSCKAQDIWPQALYQNDLLTPASEKGAWAYR